MKQVTMNHVRAISWLAIAILFSLGVSLSVLQIISPSVHAQTTTCPPPTPGSPHVCLSWKDSTTVGAQYNVYRSATSGGENYSTPLNTTPLVAGTTAYYDASVVVGNQYFYTIAAVGSGGVLSTPTSEVSAQIPVPPGSPSSPAAAID